jgi:PAS domain-containing protein
MARMGYWESHSAAATDVWISPEFAAFYEFETRDGFIPIAAVRERYLPESRKVLEAHYAACWAEGQPYAVQTRLRRSDGSVLDCVVHGEPEFDARGQVRRVSGIVRDVTEETSALRRLAESEQRLADFVSTASDWCWECPRPSAAALSQIASRQCRLPDGGLRRQSTLGAGLRA